MNVKGFDTYQRFEQALARLEEACPIWRDAEGSYDEAVTGMLRDSVIQRFEFTIELFWKTLRALLQLPPAASSRTALQEAYRAGWIDDEANWVELVRERNLTSHECNEEHAIQLADKIEAVYQPMLQAARDSLKERAVTRFSDT
jgi:nucleotidyltransferase substrate binding protein (TIGR01987 family)